MNIQNTRDCIYNLHDVVVNQKYNKTLPYSFHLKMVEAQGDKFSYLVADTDWNSVQVAEIVFLCTEMRGRNRADRKPAQFYSELRENELAVFVKLCDITANSLFSVMSGSSMFAKYKQEWKTKVKPALEPYHGVKYRPMFDYLDKIYSL